MEIKVWFALISITWVHVFSINDAVYHILLSDLSTTASMLQDLSTTLSQSVSSMIRAKRLNETKQHVLKWSHSISGLPGHIDTESEDNMDWNIRFTDKKVSS